MHEYVVHVHTRLMRKTFKRNTMECSAEFQLCELKKTDKEPYHDDIDMLQKMATKLNYISRSMLFASIVNAHAFTHLYGWRFSARTLGIQQIMRISMPFKWSESGRKVGRKANNGQIRGDNKIIGPKCDEKNYANNRLLNAIHELCKFDQVRAWKSASATYERLDYFLFNRFLVWF